MNKNDTKLMIHSKMHSSVQLYNDKLWVSKSTGNIITENKIKLKETYKHTRPFKENTGEEFMS